MTAEAEYITGPFRIVPSQQAVLHEGERIVLGGRAFEVLCALVERPGELVTKQDLFERVWPGVIVEENNLTVAISAVRRALGCGVDGQRFITTVTGRGYRFVAAVTPVAPHAVAARPDTGSARPVAPSNLPVALAPLIGRDAVVATLVGLFDRARLVTLSGAGGVGKTRVALAVGHAALDSYPDGVWLVELAALHDPELVAEVIATTLGLAIQPGKSTLDLVAFWLRQRKALLILDNCEHLLATVSQTVAILLKSCAELAVLATSREPFRVAGETVYLLPSLAVPDSTMGLTAAAALEFGAVRLFVERAAAAGGYAFSDADAPHVAEICRRLDGIALAIELAAARLRVIGAGTLLRRLDDRFHLLTGGSRTALPRHQTLRALIDWSYHLLAEDERRLLQQLSVFAGGWTLEAAVAVAGDAATDEWVMLDLLASLVDKSLVQADSQPSGTRYRLLESTKDYAAEKLHETGQTGVFRRHAGFFADLLIRAETAYETTETDAWRGAYAVELDNIRSALSWSFGPAGDTDLAVALVAYCRPLWIELSLYAERRRWLEQAAPHLHDGTPDKIAGRFYAMRGHRLLFGSRTASDDAHKAIELARRTGDPLLLGWGLINLAGTLLDPADPGEAAAVLADALAAASPLGNTNLLAGVYSTMAVAALLSGEGARARELCEQGIVIARAVGGRRTLLILTSNLAEFRFAAGDVAGAIAAAEEALVVAFRAGVKATEANTANNLGAYLLVQGETTERAAPPLLQALILARSMNETPLVLHAVQHLALVAARRGELRQAALLLGHVDAALAAERSQREPTEAATADLLRALLAESLSDAERRALAEQGAAIGLDDAAALALALGQS